MRPQPRARIGGVLARAHVVLVAVPRADDVQLVGEVVAEAAAFVVEALDDAVHQHALAHRAAGVRAAVLPGVQPAVQAEDPDLGAVDVDDHAAAFQDVLVSVAAHDRAVHGDMVSVRGAQSQHEFRSKFQDRLDRDPARRVGEGGVDVLEVVWCGSASRAAAGPAACSATSRGMKSLRRRVALDHAADGLAAAHERPGRPWRSPARRCPPAPACRAAPAPRSPG